MADNSAVLSLVIRAKNEATSQLRIVGQFIGNVRGEAGRLVSTFTSMRSLLATGLGLVGVGLSINALSSEFRQLIAELDAVNNRARALDLDPQQYLAMGYVAQQSGADIDVLTKALVKLDVASSTGNEALEELGITLDGLNPQERFLAVAKAFDAIPTQADKTRLAVRLFGGELALRVLPLLSGSIADVALEFERLGGGAIASAVDDAAGLQDAFGRVATASKALKASLLDAFGPDIEATINAIALSVADNRAEVVAYAGAMVPSGQVVVRVFGEIAGSLAFIGKSAELAFKSTIYLLGTLYNEAAKVGNLTQQILLAPQINALEGEIEKARSRLNSWTETWKYYVQEAEKAQAGASRAEIERLDYERRKAYERMERGQRELAALKAEQQKLSTKFVALDNDAMIAETSALLAGLQNEIINAGTAWDAYTKVVEFATKPLKKLLATARAIRAERATRPEAAAPPVDELAGLEFEDDTAAQMLGPDPEVWREWKRTAEDALRAVDEAIVGNEAMPLADREAALRRIVDAEIEAERVRYEAVLTEEQLAQLADARRVALEGQLGAMREAATLSSHDLFGGMAIGLKEVSSQFTLASAGADLMVQSMGTLQNSISGMFMSLIEGSFNAAEAFKAFAMAVLQQIAQMIAQMLVAIAVATLLNILFPGSSIALGAASNSLVNSGGGTFFDQFKSSGVTSSLAQSASAGTISPGAASPSQSLVQTNITNIQAVDAPSFQRLLARNSDSVAETVAGETNANFTLRSALGR